MSLSDSLTPDRTEGQARTPALAAAQEQAAPDQAMQNLFARNDVALDAAFGQMYGAGGADARAAVAQAVATEGPAAFDRLKAEPEAFGTVVGDRTQAETLGRTAEALNYWQARHTAQQEGRDVAVPGYGPGSASSEGMVRPTEAGAGPANEHSSVEVGEREPSGVINGVSDARTADSETTPDAPVSREGLSERTPEQVRHALEVIRDCLAEGSGQHVTHSDLRDAAQTLWSLREPGDASRVIHALHDEGLLNQWAEELDDGHEPSFVPNIILGASPYRGYDVAERSDFYDRLASRVDGEGLAQFASALSTEGLLSNAAEGRRFGEAMLHAEPAVRADFAHRLIGSVESMSDGQAAAAALVVGRYLGTRNESVELALSGATVSDFAVLIGAGVVSDNPALFAGQRRTLDTETAEGVLRVAEQSGNAEQMADAFRGAQTYLAGGARLATGSMDQDGAAWASAESGIRDGMTRVLIADVSGVVDQLRGSDSTSGDILSEHIGYMLQHGDSGRVRDVLDRAKFGNDLNQTSEERFGRDGLNVYSFDQRERMRDLGYVSGSIVAAVDRAAESRSERADILAGIFIGAKVFAKPASAAGELVADTIANLSRETVRETIDGYRNNPNQGLDNTIYEMSLPLNEDNEPYREREPFQAEFGTAKTLNQ